MSQVEPFGHHRMDLTHCPDYAFSFVGGTIHDLSTSAWVIASVGAGLIVKGHMQRTSDGLNAALEIEEIDAAILMRPGRRITLSAQSQAKSDRLFGKYVITGQVNFRDLEEWDPIVVT